MTLTEKAAYVKGLMDGLDIDTTTDEGKILVALYDLVAEMAETVDDIDGDIDDIVEFCNVLDEDLQVVEEYLMDEEELEDDCDCGCHCHCDDDCDCDCDCCCDDDCDCDCCDPEDDTYECVCPTCGDTIELTLPMIEEGSIECPGCGELLEFDIEEECDCEDCADDEE